MIDTMKFRALVFASIALLVAGWWYVAALEWRAERASKEILAGRFESESLPGAPLSASPGRYAALNMLAVGSSDYSKMEDYLARSVQLRPLYAPYWLDRSEVAFRSGDPAAADNYVRQVAALWPNRSGLLWKAAMLYTRLDDPQAALGVFKRYLANYPRDYARVLAISRRLEPDAASLLRNIIPDESADGALQTDLLRRILRTARSRQDDELGRAVWRVFEKDGLTIECDKKIPNNGAYSLSVQFSGNSNINFSNIRKYIPVESGERHRLVFNWRGEGITTRSGPYVYVSTVSGKRIAQTKDMWGSWDWQQEDIEFTVPQEAHFVELSVRRSKTDALDSKIKGELWLDDFSLTAIGVGGSGDYRYQAA